jgi:hypothetical protein
MIEKGEWEDGKSIFGLPKIKMLKFKIKKEKAAPEEAVEGAVAEAGAEGAAAADAKATAKGDAAKAAPGAAKKEEKPGKDAKGKK